MSIQVTKPKEVPQGEYRAIIVFELKPEATTYLVFGVTHGTEEYIYYCNTVEEAKEFYNKWKELGK